MPGPSAPCGESEKARENAFDASPVPRITLRLRLSYDPGARPQRRSMSGAFSGENRVGRMFTGIIQGKHEIVVFERSGDSARLGVRLPPELREALELGDSVAIDGVCLTVCQLMPEVVMLDMIKSTLERSIAASYEPGDLVHVERSLKLGSEIGGHELSGHVDTCATVERIERTEDNLCIFFRVDPKWSRYIFPQGFIAISGASLTISDCLDSGSLFSTWLIPETIRLTNLGDLREGDRVNVEIHRGVQVVVDTIERTVEGFLHKALEQGTLDERAFRRLTQIRRLLPLEGSESDGEH